MIPLPIDPLLPTVVDSLRGNRSLVLVAPPGAGKTTRLPPALLASDLLSAERPVVLVLQPRRVAARATAGRIAEERGCRLGEEVGYQIRNERKVGPRTRIRVVTEGILTRILLADPYLEGIGAVVLDEFHERSLHTDVALAFLREVRESVRDDLILVAMSATMDARPVSDYLGGCPVIQGAGRSFPVDISYHVHPPRSPLHERATAVLSGILEQPEDPGDILVFLPGVEEIRRTARDIEGSASRAGAVVLPLHGRLSAEEQDRALRPSDRRKVVLATNVAETSLTIDGIRTVVDTGYARYASYDPVRGLDRLELGRISRASADQRAGRAGRTAPGRCLRLWSEAEHRGLSANDPPEVRRVDLCSTVLALHAWGQVDPARFSWFEAPPAESLAAADRLLEGLSAIDSKTRRITPLGRKLLDVPLHPRLARLLREAAARGRLDDGASLAALLSERDLLRTGDGNGRTPSRGPLLRERSDLLLRLDALREAERTRFSPTLRDRGIEPNAARQIARVRDELIGTGRRWPVGNVRHPAEDDDDLLRLLLLAYPDRVCRRRGPGDGAGVMVGGRGVRLDPSSVVREAEFFLAIDPTEDRRGRALEARVRLASAVERDWIVEAFPEAVEETRELRFDEEKGRVVAVSELRYRGLILRESPHGAVDPHEAGLVLGEALRDRAVDWFRREEATASWLGRLEFLRQWMPEADLPSWGDTELGDVLAEACAGRKGLEELRGVSLLPFLRGRLTHAQARLIDAEAPEAIEVPSGSRIRLEYLPGRAPILAVRLQEIFGWTETPRVAGGRVAVLLHLLGPNFRPVQITDDLRSFWDTTYYQVRKDLRIRYPKHSWPEDPRNARPEAKGRGRR